jgi:hypothetical protein
MVFWLKDKWSVTILERLAPGEASLQMGSSFLGGEW